MQLNQPTRHGDSEVVVLTNLPPQVGAVKTSQLYLERWSVERLFQVVTEEFHCEIKTLCYPRAALFVFAMALLAYNLFSVVKAALRSVHGAGKIDAGLSDYYLALGSQLNVSGHDGSSCCAPLAGLRLPKRAAIYRDAATVSHTSRPQALQFKSEGSEEKKAKT